MVMQQERRFDDGTFDQGLFEGLGIDATSNIEVKQGGTVPAYVINLIAGFPYSVINDGRVYLHVKNSSGSACTVTVISARNDSTGLDIADVVVVVADAEQRFIGTFPPSIFNPEGSRLMTFTVSVTGNVMVGILHSQ